MALFDSITGKKNRISELKRILFQGKDTPTKLSESDLLSLAKAHASDGMRIMNDCTKIIKTTRNKDTFYYRLNLFEETARHLQELEPYVKFSGTTPSAILSALEHDKPEMIREFESRPGVMYFENMDKVEAQWSVLSNLNLFSGEQADVFESLCRQNIQEFFELMAYNDSVSPGNIHPQRVPAYTRLAMLYEKQGKYVEAVEICADAIRHGVTEDGGKGKMYGRLARMIKKSGIDFSNDIKMLAVSQ